MGTSVSSAFQNRRQDTFLIRSSTLVIKVKTVFQDSFSVSCYNSLSSAILLKTENGFQPLGSQHMKRADVQYSSN
jgi:hypothetical protein